MDLFPLNTQTRKPKAKMPYTSTSIPLNGKVKDDAYSCIPGMVANPTLLSPQGATMP